MKEKLLAGWLQLRSDYFTQQATLRKVNLLFIANIAAMAFALCAKQVQARGLGPQRYGIYALFVSITAFSVPFFRFGVFSALAALLAGQRDHRRERELLGAASILTVCVGVGYAALLVLMSFFADDVFGVPLGPVLRLVAPLCISFPFQFFVNAASTGTGLVHCEAFYLFVSRFSLFGILGLLYLFEALTVFRVILMNVLVLCGSALGALAMLRPSFRHLGRRIREILAGTRQYGFLMYLGAVSDQATYKLDGLLIAYFVNATVLGLYSLAVVVCMPLPLLSRCLCQSIFKNIALKERVPLRVFLYNALYLAGGAACLCVFGGEVLRVLFGPDFQGARSYLVLLSLAAALNGVAAPANYFLIAKKKGAWKLRSSLLMAGVNVVGNAVLIPLFGALGAAWASFVSMGVFAASCFYYYRKSVAEAEGTARTVRQGQRHLTTVITSR